MYSKILRNLIYPIIQMKYPTEEQIFKHLGILEKTQWWNLPELHQLQQKKLKTLLQHAYDNVPYYHRIFNQLDLRPHDIKSVADLSRLPVLTKDIIRNNLNDLTSRNYLTNKLVPTWTGGSTGVPMRFYIDRQWSAYNMAAAYREWGWAGYELGEKIAYLWAAPEDLSIQAELKNKIFNFIDRRIFLDVFNVSDESLDTFINVLKKFKPRYFNSIASAAFLMAQYMQKRGINDIRPNAILTSCEVLHDYQREIIEEAFNCKVFDYYSGRDTSLHAAECNEHTGYHLAIENAAVEFIKDDETVGPGELGKMIITDFSNYAMPFIRYDIGDMGILSEEKCPCGRGLPLMKSIEGRTTDILRKTDGSYITSPMLTISLKDFYNIRQIQIIQKTKTKVIIKVVRRESYTEKDSELLTKIMRSHLGEDMDIEISFVESIPPTQSGKHSFVISEIGIHI